MLKNLEVRQMTHQRKIWIVIPLNVGIVIYGVYLYLQGYSPGRVFGTILLSAVILNLVAEFSWRAASKRYRGSTGAGS
jgi:hypothetical protein